MAAWSICRTWTCDLGSLAALLSDVLCAFAALTARRSAGDRTPSNVHSTAGAPRTIAPRRSASILSSIDSLSLRRHFSLPRPCTLSVLRFASTSTRGAMAPGRSRRWDPPPCSTHQRSPPSGQGWVPWEPSSHQPAPGWGPSVSADESTTCSPPPRDKGCWRTAHNHPPAPRRMAALAVLLVSYMAVLLSPAGATTTSCTREYPDGMGFTFWPHVSGSARPPPRAHPHTPHTHGVSSWCVHHSCPGLLP
jgi:hypothetical protein